RVAAVACAAGLAGLLAFAVPHRAASPVAVAAAADVVDLPALTNSAGMRFVRLPAGGFVAGSPRLEAGRREDERQHAAAVGPGLYAAVTEVTRGQYRAVMGRPSDAPGDAGSPPDLDDTLPACPVSWASAAEFCRRLTAREAGRAYRLPTEVEWEYACRAGATGPFAGTGRLDEMGWYAGNSGGRLHAVAGKRPNRWGLFDAHGGVREWCADAYGGDEAFRGDLPSAPLMRAARGGSVDDPDDGCRSARRDARDESVPAGRTGFRPVLMLP
ncbi:MAG: putative sulfatase modifying factor 1 precursor, partial [Phycisphaerales bacterium]|nr:putative sulfatase modifying factor 1 precursor [Phycisphaerales bacterium]